MKVFNTTADMANAKLTAGQVVQTKGYAVSGDGGHATYLIKTAADFGGTPDETKDFTIANGNVAALQQGSVSDNAQKGAGNAYVGINTEDPLGGLHISISGLVPNLLTTGGGADIATLDGEALQIGHYDGVGTFTERLRVSPAGYLGVNSNDPKAPLHVVSSGTTPGVLSTGGAADYAVGAGEFMQFGHWDTSLLTFTERLRITDVGKTKAPNPGNGFFPYTTETAVSKTLAAGETCAVTVSGRTLQLPASPEVGDHVTVFVGNFINTILGRNGSNIMGLASDLTLNIADSCTELVYTDATYGWRIK